MSVLSNTFKQKAFIAYLTAGDPDLEGTRRSVNELVGAGADIIELGVPFSDPVADGPTNQRASERALKSGTTLTKILELVSTLRTTDQLLIPIVLFTYLNPIHKMGIARFISAAVSAGVTGVLVVDLPPEEAGEFTQMCDEAGLETVFLASPTTSKKRLRTIERASSGFVYYVSRTGVTGVRAALSHSLKNELKALKTAVKKPIAVGFGISNHLQVSEIADWVDGIVVGSAIVDIIEKKGSISELVSPMVRALRGESAC